MVIKTSNTFGIEITKDGICYPDQVIIKINKGEIFKRELKPYVESNTSNEELGKILRKLING